jgi:hypothetical protein
MNPKLAIALPANLPDCAGNSPIAQPDAERHGTELSQALWMTLIPWLPVMTGRRRPEPDGQAKNA